MRLIRIYGMQELGDLALGILLVAMTIGITLVALDKFASSLTAGSLAQNKTHDLITEVGQLPGWVGIIVIVFVAAIIFYYLRMLRGGPVR